MMVVLGIGQEPLMKLVAPDLIDPMMTIRAAFHTRPRPQAPCNITIGVHDCILHDHIMPAMIPLTFQSRVENILCKSSPGISLFKIGDVDYRPYPIAQKEHSLK